MKTLSQIKTVPPAHADKKACKQGLTEFHKRLYDLQNIFYADGRYALLVILQGMDTSGKDGTIRHVMSCMNPMGLHVKSFKQPSVEELKHDFLWRVYPHFPPKGMIHVFNRSYYEDILVPRVDHSISVKDLAHRCRFINELESHLIRNDIHILKFFLHISLEEQQERIQERKTLLRKRWKYDNADEQASKKWDDYSAGYEMLINQCNEHPWHVIPADKRWYRNYLVAKILNEHLENLKLKYPNT